MEWTAHLIWLDELRTQMRSLLWFNRSTERLKWKWRTLDEALLFLKNCVQFPQSLHDCPSAIWPLYDQDEWSSPSEETSKTSTQSPRVSIFSAQDSSFLPGERLLSASSRSERERDYSSERYFSCVPKTDHTDRTEDFYLKHIVLKHLLVLVDMQYFI